NCHDFLIDGNVFHDIGRTSGLPFPNHDHGLYLHGTNFTIINNIFYNLAKGWGIQTADGLANALIVNNTFAFPNSSEDGQIMLWGKNSNILIRNNIFYMPRNYAIARQNSTISGCTIDHNIVYGASGLVAEQRECASGANWLGTDPDFVSAAAPPYDFHL